MPRDTPARDPVRDPLRGADPVNDGDLEVGFDESFERRFRWLEWGGRIVLVLVVAIAGIGLLGRGPLSHAQAVAPDRASSVDYEPLARYGTATQVTLRVRPPASRLASIDMIRVAIDPAFVEPMGLQSIEPRPASAAADAGGEVLTFARATGAPETLIRFQLRPTEVGVLSLSARVDDGAALRWTQVILP